MWRRQWICSKISKISRPKYMRKEMRFGCPEPQTHCPLTIPRSISLTQPSHWKGWGGDATTHSFHCWVGPEFELRFVSAIIVLWFVTATPICNPLHKPRPLDATSNPHIPHPPSLLEKYIEGAMTFEGGKRGLFRLGEVWMRHHYWLDQ
jgi:hypothetical protein